MREHPGPFSTEHPILIFVQFGHELCVKCDVAARCGSVKCLMFRPPESYRADVQIDRVPSIFVLVGREVIAETGPGEKVDGDRVRDRFLNFGRTQPGRDITTGFVMRAETPLGLSMGVSR